HPVDAPVAGAGQAVALLVAGGGVQRCGAVPGREVAAAGEAGDVGDVAEQPGRAGRADACNCCRVLPVAVTRSVSCRSAALIFLSMPASSAMSSAASWRVRPTTSR